MKLDPFIPVLMTLSSTSQQEGDPEPESIDLITSGRLRQVAGGYQLDYTETQPEDNSSQDISLLITPPRVTMTRKGGFATSMVFMKDQRFEGQYHTPYGDLSMAIYSTKVACDLSDDSGAMHLKYEINVQGQFAASHDLRLTYQRKDKS